MPPKNQGKVAGLLRQVHERQRPSPDNGNTRVRTRQPDATPNRSTGSGLHALGAGRDSAKT